MQRYHPQGSYGSTLTVKLYGAGPATTDDAAGRRYSPAECVGIRKEVITGKPDPKHVSTSYVERSNLSIRMHNRRFTRLTNAHSKKLENYIWGVALHVMFYNFARLHSTLRTSPAMAAGITHRLWDMTDIIAIMNMRETPPKRPATNRKRGAAAEFSNRDSTTLYCQKSAERPKTPKKAPIPARALLRALRQS